MFKDVFQSINITWSDRNVPNGYILVLNETVIWIWVTSGDVSPESVVITGITKMPQNFTTSNIEPSPWKTPSNISFQSIYLRVLSLIISLETNKPLPEIENTCEWVWAKKIGPPDFKFNKTVLLPPPFLRDSHNKDKIKQDWRKL